MLVRCVGNAFEVSALELFEAFNRGRKKHKLLSFKGSVVRFPVRGRRVEFPEEVFEWEAKDVIAARDFLRFLRKFINKLEENLEEVAKLHEVVI